MAWRHRNKESWTAQGAIYYPPDSGTIIGGSSYPAITQEMWDITGKTVRKSPPVLKGLVPASTMESTQVRINPCQYSGTGYYRFENVAVGNHYIPDDGDAYRPPWNLARQDLDWAYALELCAATNPYRADFSVPVFIRELVDLPSMFRLAAKNFFNYLGSQYLNYRFGWLSFVDDVRTLHSLTKLLEARMRELKSLKRHGGLSSYRKLDVITDNYTWYNYPINSTWGVYIYADGSTSRTTRISGTVRWALSGDIDPDLERISLFNSALNNVLDLEKIDPSTMWNLIPWTWLVDYFVNVGDYLAAQEGPYDLRPYDICIMWKLKSQDRYHPKPHDLVTVTKGVHTRTVNSRSHIEGLRFPSIRTTLFTRREWEVILALVAKFHR